MEKTKVKEFENVVNRPSDKTTQVKFTPEVFAWLVACASKMHLKNPGTVVEFLIRQIHARETGGVVLRPEPPSIYLVREFIFTYPDKTMSEITERTGFSYPSVVGAVKRLDKQGEIVRRVGGSSIAGPRPQVFSLSDEGRKVVEAKKKKMIEDAEAKARAAQPFAEIIKKNEEKKNDVLKTFKHALTLYAAQELEAEEHPSEEATASVLELGEAMKVAYEAAAEYPTERMQIVAEVNAYIENLKAEHREFPEDPSELG